MKKCFSFTRDDRLEEVIIILAIAACSLYFLTFLVTGVCSFNISAVHDKTNDQRSRNYIMILSGFRNEKCSGIPFRQK